MSAWTLVRFLHVASAVVWVGGQLALGLVVRQAAASTLEEEARARLFTAAGARFGRLATLVLMPLLVATGLGLAFHRGVSLAALSRPGYGTILTVKVALAFLSFALAGVHGALASRQSRGARTVGVSGTAVSLLVVLLATSLVP